MHPAVVALPLQADLRPHQITLEGVLLALAQGRCIAATLGPVAAHEHHRFDARGRPSTLVPCPDLHLAHAAAAGEGHRGRRVVRFAGAPVFPGKQLIALKAKTAKDLTIEMDMKRKHEKACGNTDDLQQDK